MSGDPVSWRSPHDRRKQLEATFEERVAWFHSLLHSGDKWYPWPNQLNKDALQKGGEKLRTRTDKTVPTCPPNSNFHNNPAILKIKINKTSHIVRTLARTSFRFLLRGSPCSRKDAEGLGFPPGQDLWPSLRARCYGYIAWKSQIELHSGYCTPVRGGQGGGCHFHLGGSFSRETRLGQTRFSKFVLHFKLVRTVVSRAVNSIWKKGEGKLWVSRIS